MGNISVTNLLNRKASPRPREPAVTTISDALFTKTQQRLLALLFGQPERAFHTKELIDLAGVGSGSAQREIARLRDSGLVLQSQLGNRHLYRANPGSPVFNELRGIIDKTLGVAPILQRALGSLSSDLRLALLYGSIARGSGTSGSDIDLLIVSDMLTLEQIYEAIAPAEKQLGRPINPTLYTTPEFQQRIRDGNRFLTKVIEGKTVTLVGDLDALGPA